MAFADGKTFLYGKDSNEILACLDGNNKVSFKEDSIIFHRMGSPNYDTLTPAAFLFSASYDYCSRLLIERDGCRLLWCPENGVYMILTNEICDVPSSYGPFLWALLAEDGTEILPAEYLHISPRRRNPSELVLDVVDSHNMYSTLLYDGKSISVLSPPSKEEPPRKIMEVEGIGTVHSAHDRAFIVDSSGKELFTTDERFYYIPYHGDGYWVVEPQKGKVGILDRDLKAVLPASRYDSVEYCGNSTFVLSA